MPVLSSLGASPPRASGLGVLCGIVLMLCGTGFGAAQDVSQPPGILYPVADTTIHVNCMGSGAPAVMLEAGLGGNSLDWTYVQARVAPTHRICAYDRAGAGWSGRTARPRNAANMAEELHLAAVAAKISTPFILVGHSFGGLLSQNYLARYPGEIAGLVLVDSMHPDQFARFTEAGVDVPTDPHGVLGHTPAAAAAYGLPEPLQAVAISLARSGKTRVFVVREMSAMLQIAHDVDAEPRPLRPIRVLVHGNREWDVPYPDGRMEAAWRAMQADLAKRFGASTLTIVEGSGHEIPLDRPAAVVTAIEDVVREVVAARPL
ncbi:alpha/beta fold hydrolase [Lichenifustis flavocetrariae]|uniref:Alpha/beta hydrolase n=1 Tax=Lichenifustis flavocetrariae TaxID=2949735 RepID=A0AA41YQF3_9HYPH|nr:alpha/beta hydrolase [Lichenifustis flavocetrariae]MCW6506636.1 alpha/beta hydrolase [Lichenifustis flavocetrariae]